MDAGARHAGPPCIQQLSGQALEADGAGHEPRRRDTLQFDAVLGADAAQEDVFQRAALWPSCAPLPETTLNEGWAMLGGAVRCRPANKVVSKNGQVAT